VTLALPVHPDTIHEELISIDKIVAKWKARVNEGIPCIDLPGPDAEEALDNFLREFSGELLLVAGKAHNLAIVLAER
jgi:hypothetical protein